MLVVIFVCAGNWLVMRVRKNYARMVAAQGLPTNAPPVVLRHTLSDNGTNVLLLMGDSRIAAWEAPAASGWNVFNGGVGGMTAAQLAFHCRAMLERARPTVVVLQIGINDLKILGLEPSLREAVVGAYLSNITTIVRECRASGAHVVVTTIWPAGKVPLKRRVVWSPAIPASRKRTRNWKDNLPASPASRLRTCLPPRAGGCPKRKFTGFTGTRCT